MYMLHVCVLCTSRKYDVAIYTICYNPIGLDRWLPIRPAHKDDEISGEVLVALRLEKIFTATNPSTEKVCNTYSIVFTYLFEACKSESTPISSV